MDTFQRISNPQLSSSPGFGTPVHPIPPTQPARAPPPPAFKPTVQSVLPTNLPPQTLRPLAFRTFTKKYNLTLNSSALQALAIFIGRHCGSSWREEGTGEKVLEEVAKLWKAESGPVIVDDGVKLKGILRTLEGSMSGGRVGPVKRAASDLSRQSSFAFGNDSAVDLTSSEHRPSLDGRNSSFGMSKLQVEESNEEPEDNSQDPRAWMKVVSAFEQPRLSYDAEKKHFSQRAGKPSMFPSPRHKTEMFRERYNIIQQRLLRNENFQAPSITSTSSGTSLHRQDSKPTERQFYKITPIANLLGRSGASFLLLGMLVIAPTGTLAINDGSGSISLDLQHAHTFGEEQSYFCTGMIVLVEGTYEESWAGAGSSGLGNTGGVGGTIGGRFIGFSIGGPPVEKRNVSLGIDLKAGDQGGGFGWMDFLGLGSERAVGQRMRRLEKRLLRPDGQLEGGDSTRKMVILSEVTLDDPTTFTALRKVLSIYAAASEAPMAFTLMGNFSSQAAMAGAGTGSIEYKELFDALAAVLADYPSLLRSSTWVFVPGDNDPWSSAFSAGASTLIPRDGIPDLFTSRIKRAFAAAKSEVGVAKKEDELDGEAIWTSNPTRLSFFGPLHEVVLFRDDISGRLRRNAVRIGQASEREEEAAAQQQSLIDEDTTMSGALPGTDTTPEPAAIPPPLPTSRDSSDDYTTAQAKKLILTLLPQSTLSPFPLQTRPVHWTYGPSALSLYPLPNTLVLADAEAPAFALTYEGCHVINPGRLVSGRGRVGWVEYDVLSKRGKVRGEWVG